MYVHAICVGWYACVWISMDLYCFVWNPIYGFYACVSMDRIVQLYCIVGIHTNLYEMVWIQICMDTALGEGFCDCFIVATEH